MQSDLWERAVTYAAIGATQSPDLLRYPPAGYRPIERTARIGHGEARYDYAWLAALTWGIQRNSGFRVTLTDAPPEVTEASYTPISFDAAGEPIAPTTLIDVDEVVYGADGTRLLAPGDTALLGIGPFLKFPVRVIYVVDEPRRRGFAYGTLPGHPEDGEESWMVEHRDDDSVWITIRAFSRPATRWWWAVYPVLRVMQEYYTRRYLRALAGPIA
jgi:uncharacterized protein (UPF0548 family)